MDYSVCVKRTASFQLCVLQRSSSADSTIEAIHLALAQCITELFISYKHSGIWSLQTE